MLGPYDTCLLDGALSGWPRWQDVTTRCSTQRGKTGDGDAIGHSSVLLAAVEKPLLYLGPMNVCIKSCTNLC